MSELRGLRGGETATLLPTENKGIAKDSDGKFWFWDEAGHGRLWTV